MHGRRFLLRRVPRTLGANIERKKKTGIKEKRKVSTLDAAFWAIKSISSNLDRAIPEQEMPASKLLEGGKQLLCLHTEHKLKIWFNKMPLFSAGGRCLISSFRLLFTNSINRFFFSSSQRVTHIITKNTVHLINTATDFIQYRHVWQVGGVGSMIFATYIMLMWVAFVFLMWVKVDAPAKEFISLTGGADAELQFEICHKGATLCLMKKRPEM